MAPGRLQPESQGGGVVNQRGYGESPPSPSPSFALTTDWGLDAGGEEEQEQEEEEKEKEEEGQAATECGVSKEMSGKYRKEAGATDGNRLNTEGRSGDTTQVSWQLERVTGAT